MSESDHHVIISTLNWWVFVQNYFLWWFNPHLALNCWMLSSCSLLWSSDCTESSSKINFTLYMFSFHFSFSYGLHSNGSVGVGRDLSCINHLKTRFFDFKGMQLLRFTDVYWANGELDSGHLLKRSASTTPCWNHTSFPQSDFDFSQIPE